MSTLNTYAPIVVTVYHRLDHLKRCVNALLRNELAMESELIVLSDAPQKEEHAAQIELVRKYILSITGFKKVRPVFWPENKGGHNSVVDGIREVLKEYDSFIFLEDDILVAPSFLRYMNEGLRYYEKQKSVFSVCAFKLPFSIPENYNKDIFFYPCNSPWGIATWKDRWEKVDHSYFDRYSELKRKGQLKEFCSIGFYIKGILKKDSTREIVADDLRVYYHMFQNKMCSVFPVISQSQNWGFDGSGEHCGDEGHEWAKPKLNNEEKAVVFEPFTSFDQKILSNYRQYQDKINGGIIAKYLKYTWLHDIYRRIKTKVR